MSSSRGGERVPRVPFGGGLTAEEREGGDDANDPSRVTVAEPEPAAASSSSGLSSPYPGMDILRRCEERYKVAVGEVGKGLGAFFDAHVQQNPQADKVLGGFYSDYNLTIFTHSILGGAFGYILSRAVTTRLAPSPRLFAVTSFTALSAFMGAFSATRLATAELIKKSMPYTKAKETSWPLLLACRPLMQLKPCVEDRACRELLDAKVDNGKTMLEAYITCRRRAEVWATQDEYMQIREEVAAREGEAGFAEAEEVADEESYKEEFFGGDGSGFVKDDDGGNGKSW